MALAAGRLRHRVTLQAPTPSRDTNTGESIDSWATVDEAWASFEPLSAREFIQSAALQAEVVARITIRARSDILPTWRIIYRGNAYKIEGVLPDKESGLEYITLPVSEGLAQIAPISISGTLPDGQVGKAYSGALTISGGVAAYALASATLPDGLSASLAGATINISGTPAEDGSPTVSIAVTGLIGDGTFAQSIEIIPGAPAVDLFIIVGQSNAEGRGDSALSPAAPNGLYISGSTITSPLADPVGGASTGSMWPAFSNEWFVQTGRLSAFVEAAKGSTSLLAPADGGNGNWSPDGTLRASAVAAAASAIQAINDSPFYELGAVYFIWAQGESEAQAVNGTTITGALYQQALEDLADYFASEVPEMTMMGVVRLGMVTPRTGEAGWAEIRQAQEDACAASDLLRILYRGTASFTTPGMDLMLDAADVHYGQAGYNLAGKCASRELSKESETPALNAPARLAHQAYTDTSWATKTSQTRSHTTHASTKALVVAIPAVRGGNSTASIGTCTFNGVAMKLVNTQGQQGAASPVGLNGLTGCFYLNEADYGASLGGVTANIVHTPAANQSILPLVAFDLDTEVRPDNSAAGTSTIAAGSTTAITMTVDEAAFVVSLAAVGASGGTVPTGVLSGMTEVLDAGGTISGADRSGAGCVGYASVGASVGNDFGGSYSANVTGAQLVVAFRAKIDGE